MRSSLAKHFITQVEAFASGIQIFIRLLLIFYSRHGQQFCSFP